mmetsp:Transcript_29002/g.27962  ORF Transcript_29002/g.27962 Transcript_29002/m.27962 type:complete len:327 (+) Transcript_29002:706-1686(+)
MLKGYHKICRVNSEKTHTTRQMNPKTFRVLNFILHSVLGQFYKSNLINHQQLCQILPVQDIQNELGISALEYLDAHVDANLKALRELLDLESPHIWLYHVLNDFSIATFAFSETSTFKERTHFEMEFEESIIKDADSMKYTIRQNYSVNLQNVQKRTFNDLIINEQPINDDKNQKMFEELRYLGILRFSSESTFENMRQEFERSYFSNRNRHQIIKLCFTYQFEAKKLNALATIIDFTNKLIGIYDHMLTREEARDKEMQTVIEEHPELDQSFKEFRNAMSQVGKEPVQFGCKKLESREFNYSTLLSSLLLDKSEQGGGMYVAAVI